MVALVPVARRRGNFKLNFVAATNLHSLGVDVKVAQELPRHANSRITMDLYTRAVSADKRSASGRQVEMLLGHSDKLIIESSLVIPRDEPKQLSGAINR